MQIKIRIERHRPLVIGLDDTLLAETYIKVLQRNLVREDFIFRDPIKYTTEYFQKLCQQVKDQLDWDWIKDEYSIEQTTTMHKFIESALDKTESFKNIPGDQQNLVHEAHFCIHQIQHKEKIKHGEQNRTPSIQIEWFNDDHEKLPDGTEFVHEPDFGDLILQNPYVGHPPMQCWQQDDYKNISRTCQFHDIVKPGIKIVTTPTQKIFNLKDYKAWWFEKCNDYVQSVGWETIEYYTGMPRVGKVFDKENLCSIMMDKKPLNITKIELI